MGKQWHTVYKGGERWGSKGTAINNAKKAENGGSGDRQDRTWICHAGGMMDGKQCHIVIKWGKVW